MWKEIKPLGYDTGIYTGSMFIDSPGKGFDFLFKPLKNGEKARIRIRQLDFDKNVRVLVNGNECGYINEQDGVISWAVFSVDPAFAKTKKDNLVRIEHDGGNADWGYIFSVVWDTVTALADEAETKANNFTSDTALTVLQTASSYAAQAEANAKNFATQKANIAETNAKNASRPVDWVPSLKELYDIPDGMQCGGVIGASLRLNYNGATPSKNEITLSECPHFFYSPDGQRFNIPTGIIRLPWYFSSFYNDNVIRTFFLAVIGPGSNVVRNYYAYLNYYLCVKKEGNQWYYFGNDPGLRQWNPFTPSSSERIVAEVSGSHVSGITEFRPIAETSGAGSREISEKTQIKSLSARTVLRSEFYGVKAEALTAISSPVRYHCLQFEVLTPCILNGVHLKLSADAPVTRLSVYRFHGEEAMIKIAGTSSYQHNGNKLNGLDLKLGVGKYSVAIYGNNLKSYTGTATGIYAGFKDNLHLRLVAGGSTPAWNKVNKWHTHYSSPFSENTCQGIHMLDISFDRKALNCGLFESEPDARTLVHGASYQTLENENGKTKLVYKTVKGACSKNTAPEVTASDAEYNTGCAV